MNVSGTSDLEEFRDYLRLLACSLLSPKLRIKIDASDLVQQTMLDAHRNLAEFEGATDAQLGAWLRQILKNNFLNSVRAFHRVKRDIRKEKPIEWDRLSSDSFARVDHWISKNQSTASEKLSRKEQLLQLPAALNRLSEPQREAIVLFHIQGLKLAEVAKRLNRSESAIGGLLYRGLKQLRQNLNHDADSEVN